jgi:uncharacterized Zn finger protein
MKVPAPATPEAPSPAAPARPNPSPASLADRVARSFPPQSCVAGFAAFVRRDVDIVVIDDSSVDARVKTKRTRRLAFRVKNGVLLVSCTCAPGLDLVGCRHAWGAILEIDRQGALASLRARRGPLHIGRLAEAPPATARTENRRATSRKRRRRTASAA